MVSLAPEMGLFTYHPGDVLRGTASVTGSLSGTGLQGLTHRRAVQPGLLLPELEGVGEVCDPRTNPSSSQGLWGHGDGGPPCPHPSTSAAGRAGFVLLMMCPAPGSSGAPVAFC